MKLKIIIAITSLFLISCGSATAPSAIPGSGGKQIYELMEEEDSTEQKADTVKTPSAP